MLRRKITPADQIVLVRLHRLALQEAAQSPAVAEERRRIADWIEQTATEGWLPFTIDEELGRVPTEETG